MDFVRSTYCVGSAFRKADILDRSFSIAEQKKVTVLSVANAIEKEQKHVLDKFCERSHRYLDRDLGIRTMLVQKIDLFDAEFLKRFLERLPDELSISSYVHVGKHKATFCCDE